jgi:amidase
MPHQTLIHQPQRFMASENTTADSAYFAALAANADLGKTRGIDGVMEKFNLDAILLPTDGGFLCKAHIRYFLSFCLVGFSPTPAAIAGYPIITVPLGFQPDDVAAGPANPVVENAPGLPFGIVFMGTAFSEFNLIKFAFAYEQATHTRRKRLAFPAAIPTTQLADVM